MSQTASQPPAKVANAEQVIVRVRALQKSFRMGDSSVHVLKSVDLNVRAGEFLAIEGRSGSGKSTLLHLMGALDMPDAGTIEYNGTDLATAGETARSRLRNRDFGFVFQFYHLLPELNVLENVELTAMVEYSWLAYFGHRKEVRRRATEVLTMLGMEHRLTHRPNQLSGGERQRVAIARALMSRPRVLFADEPTGNLDADTGRQIMGVFEDLHRSGQTIIMVTHDRTIAKQADRALILKEGKLVAPSAGETGI